MLPAMRYGASGTLSRRCPCCCRVAKISVATRVSTSSALSACVATPITEFPSPGAPLAPALPLPPGRSWHLVAVRASTSSALSARVATPITEFPSPGAPLVPDLPLPPGRYRRSLSDRERELVADEERMQRESIDYMRSLNVSEKILEKFPKPRVVLQPATELRRTVDILTVDNRLYPRDKLGKLFSQNNGYLMLKSSDDVLSLLALLQKLGLSTDQISKVVQKKGGSDFLCLLAPQLAALEANADYLKFAFSITKLELAELLVRKPVVLLPREGTFRKRVDTVKALFADVDALKLKKSVLVYPQILRVRSSNVPDNFKFLCDTLFESNELFAANALVSQFRVLTMNPGALTQSYAKHVGMYGEDHCRAFLKMNPFRLVVASKESKTRAVHQCLTELGFNSADLLAQSYAKHVGMYGEDHCQAFLKMNPFRLVVASKESKTRALHQCPTELGFNSADLLAQYPMIGQSTPPNIRRTFEWVSEVFGEGFIRVHAELLRLNADDNLKPTLEAAQELGVELFDVRRNYHILFCSLRDRIRPVRRLMAFHDLIGRLESGHVHRILLKLDSSSLRELSGRLQRAYDIFDSSQQLSSGADAPRSPDNRISESSHIPESESSQKLSTAEAPLQSLDNHSSESSHSYQSQSSHKLSSVDASGSSSIRNSEITPESDSYQEPPSSTDAHLSPDTRSSVLSPSEGESVASHDPRDVMHVVREKDPWLYIQLGRDRSKLLRFEVPG